MKKYIVTIAIIFIAVSSAYSQTDSKEKEYINLDTKYHRISIGVGIFSSLTEMSNEKSGLSMNFDLTYHIIENLHIGLKADIYNSFHEFNKIEGLLALQPQLEFKVNNNIRLLPGLGVTLFLNPEGIISNILTPSIKYEYALKNNIALTVEARMFYMFSEKNNKLMISFCITHRAISK